MHTGLRPISVKHLPAGSDLRRKLLFMEEVESCLTQRRPCLVLDCSSLDALDESAVHLMFHCLEEALKRNGDVKLAALPEGAQGAFRAAGLARLFEVYATVAEAVASFHAVPVLTAVPVAEAAAQAA